MLTNKAVISALFSCVLIKVDCVELKQKLLCAQGCEGQTTHTTPVFSNSLLVPCPQLRYVQAKVVTRHTDTSCLSSHTFPSSVDTSGDELVHRGWLCLTLFDPFQGVRIAEIPFPSWAPTESCQRFLLVIIQMDKITIQVTASSRREDLALWLEKAAPALLRYSPHAVQSGILRHHMLEKR